MEHEHLLAMQSGSRCPEFELVTTGVTAAQSGACTDVAQHYAVHRRTMNRYLKAAGTGFRAVADGVGFEIARQLIADTDIPLAQISAMLDFSEPTAFTRAFHRRSGDTPSDYRAERKPALV